MLKTLLRIRIAAFATQVAHGASRKRGGDTGKLLGFALLFLFILGSFGLLFYEIFSAMAAPLHAAGADWVYFTFFALLAFVVMFVFSVFTAKSQLFEARDNELLLSLPVKPHTVLSSRLLLLIVLNLGFELTVAVPVALCGHFGGALSVLAFVLICLALPLFSVALSSLFGWIIAKISAHTRHKSLVSTVLALVFLAAYFYFYTDFMQNGMEKLLASVTHLEAAVSGFAPLLWLGRAMAEGDALSLLLCLVCLLVPFVIAYLLLSATFIRTVTEKSHVSKVEYKEKTLTVSTASKALLRKELNRFTASSVYMLNAGLGLVFLLAAAVALVIEKKAILSLDLGELTAFLPMALAAAITFLHSMTTITAPSVSLEGQSLWIGQSLPVDPFTVIWAKAKLQLVMSLPLSVLASLGAVYVAEPDIPTAIFMILYPTAFAVLIALVGLVANLKHPNFTWMNETQVVKQGISLLITMLLGMALAIGFGALLLFLTSRGQQLLGFAAVTLLCALIDGICYRWLRRRGGVIYTGLA
jgi:ABC-2 type transport system permease protein